MPVIQACNTPASKRTFYTHLKTTHKRPHGGPFFKISLKVRVLESSITGASRNTQKERFKWLVMGPSLPTRCHLPSLRRRSTSRYFWRPPVRLARDSFSAGHRVSLTHGLDIPS